MTKAELIEMLSDPDVPDSAQVYFQTMALVQYGDGPGPTEVTATSVVCTVQRQNLKVEGLLVSENKIYLTEV